MSENDGELGCRVRERRQARGWTLTQLASEVGMSKGFASAIENGKANPSGRKLLRLSAALATSIDWLLTGEVPADYPGGPPLLVPRELANLAEDRQWMFARVRSLIGAREAIVARRPSGHARHPFTTSQWAELAERLEPYLDEVAS